MAANNPRSDLFTGAESTLDEFTNIQQTESGPLNIIRGETLFSQNAANIPNILTDQAQIRLSPLFEGGGPQFGEKELKAHGLKLPFGLKSVSKSGFGRLLLNQERLKEAEFLLSGKQDTPGNNALSFSVNLGLGLGDPVVLALGAGAEALSLSLRGAISSSAFLARTVTAAKAARFLTSESLLPSALRVVTEEAAINTGLEVGFTANRIDINGGEFDQQQFLDSVIVNTTLGVGIRGAIGAARKGISSTTGRDAHINDAVSIKDEMDLNAGLAEMAIREDLGKTPVAEETLTRKVREAHKPIEDGIAQTQLKEARTHEEVTDVFHRLPQETKNMFSRVEQALFTTTRLGGINSGIAHLVSETINSAFSVIRVIDPNSPVHIVETDSAVSFIANVAETLSTVLTPEGKAHLFEIVGDTARLQNADTRAAKLIAKLTKVKGKEAVATVNSLLRRKNNLVKSIKRNLDKLESGSRKTQGLKVRKDLAASILQDGSSIESLVRALSEFLDNQEGSIAVNHPEIAVPKRFETIQRVLKSIPEITNGSEARFRDVIAGRLEGINDLRNELPKEFSSAEEVRSKDTAPSELQKAIEALEPHKEPSDFTENLTQQKEKVTALKTKLDKMKKIGQDVSKAEQKLKSQEEKLADYTKAVEEGINCIAEEIVNG